jgi:hypothetical protein
MGTAKKPGDSYVDTGGGAFIGGNVNTGGGKFVGRDDTTTYVQQGDRQEGVTLDAFLQLLADIKSQAKQAGLEEGKTRAVEYAETEAKAQYPDRDQIINQLERVDKALKTVGQVTDAGKKLAELVGKAIGWARTLFGV